MHSISHGIATAYAIQSFTDAAIKRKDNKCTTAEEVSASKTAKRKAMRILRDIINSVDDTLATLRGPARISEKRDVSTTLGSSTTDLLFGPPDDKTLLSGEDPEAVAKKILEDMSPESLAKQNVSLLEMAESIGPIVDNLNGILTKPYLQNYNASLCTVPVVGLKNNQIMYINTTAKTDEKDGKDVVTVSDSWALFSSLPTDAKITNPTEVHFFPYYGDFYLSVGTALWKKQRRSDEDPQLSSAVDNWPKLYYDDWTKIGDACLPAPNLKSIISFAILGPDKDLSKPVPFRLVVLDQNNSIQVIASDHLTANNAFVNLEYKRSSSKDSPTEAPRWTRLAYWNNQITGLDDSNNTYDITPDFEKKTYTADTKLSVQQFTDFTATEVGPVGAGADGNLYKRIVEPPPKGKEDESPTLKWQFLIAQDGVTNLGVASPGVFLDLRLLTQTLRERYLSTQTAVAPAVQNILAFAGSHEYYLTQLKEQADIYNSTASTEEQRQQALKVGKEACQYALVWAGILNRSIGGSQDATNIMSHQFSNIKSQLIIQTQLLKDRLDALQAQLDANEEELDKLMAGFWVTLGCMLLGLALVAVGCAPGCAPALKAGGFLFALGLLATLALTITVAVMSRHIAEDQDEIRTTNQAIEELSEIRDRWVVLSDLLGNLSVFWGTLQTDTVIVSIDDEVTMMLIGEDTLSQTSTILSAMEITSEIEDACKKYLEVLYRQGVPIPLIFLEDYSPDFGAIDDRNRRSALTNGNIATDSDDREVGGIPPREVKNCIDGVTPFINILLDDSINLDVLFYQVTAYANSRLSEGDFSDYVACMQYASMVSAAAITRMNHTLTATGMWFDQALLGQTLPMWSGFSQNVLKSWPKLGNSTPDTPESLNLMLEQVKPMVIDMLQKTIFFATEAMVWATRYPSAPKEVDITFEDFRKKALDACQSALTAAATANNSFIDFNHAATAFTQNMEAQINTNLHLIEIRKAEAARDISQIKIPWYVFLSPIPAAAVAIYEAKQKSDINERLNKDVDNLNKTIQLLKSYEDSGRTISGSSVVWQTMAQEVSVRLGDMCNTLIAMKDQIEVNPELYADFIGQEWGELIKNAQDVLNILGT